MKDSRSIDFIGFRLYDDWLRIKRKKKNITDFFKNNYYKEIAIYGMGYIGIQLFEELEETDIHVRYAIDKNADMLNIDGLDIYTLSNIPKEINIDAFVVTPIPHFCVIEQELNRVFENRDVISVEDVIWYSK